MMTALRVAVAEDEPVMRQFLSETLTLLGHQVVAVVASGRDLVRQCKLQHPELVITDIRMSDLDGLDAAEQIYADEPVPIIVVSGYYDPDLIERAERQHIIAYLVKPIKQENLVPAIGIAMQRFSEFQEARREANTLRQALEDRKIIERAKGILMKRANLNEDDAFRRLQHVSRDRNQKLVEVARMIVTAEEAFHAK